MAESALEQGVGKMGVALIGGNLLAWLKQYPQSIAPFFTHAPVGYMMAAAAYAKAQNGLNGNTLVDEVRAMSAVMRNRTRLVEKEYIKFAQENAKTPAGRKMAQMAEKLFILQDAADTTCVTIGWKAVYDTERAQGKSHKEAVRQADWVVNRTQPTVESTEIMAGLRKGKGHLPRFLTMFAMPGSKVFGMYIDGLPRAVREGNARYIVGHLLGQAISGIACAALMGAFKDDDDDDKLKKAAYAATIEPLLGTIPLPYVSNAVTWAAEQMIGISRSQYPSANYLPLVDSGVKTVVDIKKVLSADGKKKEKALKALVRDALSTTGYSTGLPAAQLNRIMRAVEDEKGVMSALLGW
jgi:hypothetical protein